MNLHPHVENLSLISTSELEEKLQHITQEDEEHGARACLEDSQALSAHSK